MCVVTELREYARVDYDPSRADILNEAANIIRFFQIYYSSVNDALSPAAAAAAASAAPAVVHAPKSVLESFKNRMEKPREPIQVPQTLKATRTHAEKQHMIDILKACKGNRTAAAKMLKISRTAFYKKLRKYDLMDMQFHV
jgi:transcriptional regulator of acetoin/glycerol metabolism